MGGYLQFLAAPEQKEMGVNQLVHRYYECLGEKNDPLVRFDIIQDLRKRCDRVQDETIRVRITTQERNKYRKKYSELW